MTVCEGAGTASRFERLWITFEVRAAPHEATGGTNQERQPSAWQMLIRSGRQI
jgi:hypothetical protein